MASRGCTSEELVRRLHKVEGQVRGLGHMVERGERPVDVLTQLAAARGALDSVALALVAAELDAADADEQRRDATIAAVTRLVRM